MNSSIKKKYGFLYTGYKEKNYYWESILMIRKVSILSIGTFLSPWGDLIRAYFLMIFLTIFLFHTSRQRPYKQRALNTLETTSLASLLGSVFLGLFFFSEQDAYQVTPVLQWSLFGMILIVNLVFIVLWVANFCSQVSDSIRRKYPKIYYIFCACCHTRIVDE